MDSVVTATKRSAARAKPQSYNRSMNGEPKAKRIGVYSGAFDPVHSGHIAFALQAMTAARLDELYFLPERRPQHKQGVEHFGHRVAMLNRAIKPHLQFRVLELEDVSFTVERTLAKLLHRLPAGQLVFLLGSDAAAHITEWPKIERLFKVCELVIGVRSETDLDQTKQLVESWPVLPKATTIFESYASDVSSGKVRDGLRKRQPVAGLLKSVERYSNRHWLYVSFT